ncbi:MAG: hypothetical protein C0596_17055 [Marinilabiliales bacterium]|nr:MAG: hypothetical protein C0596_17055 [Marinilabiliales bacterium]
MIKDRKRHITDCLVITGGLVIIGFLKDLQILYYIAAVIAISSALIPFVAKIISYLWQGLGKALGFVVSKILLSAIFYLFLFPISLLQKLFSRKKSIITKRNHTYWIKKEKKEIDFSKPW